MRALVYTGPEQMALRDVPDPEPTNDEVMVRISACGICGSDMHAYHGHDERRPPPLILGHEAAGTVLTGALAGKRVAINPLVTCGTCDMCIEGRTNVCASRQIISTPARPGAFAELVRIPERQLVVVPDGLALEIAALSEPVAVSYHSVTLGERALARPLSAARIVVIGGGAIGLAAAQVLASRGGRNILIAETSAIRRKRIDAAGRFKTYDPAAANAPKASTIDLVVDAYGGKGSRAESSRVVRPGGVIVHIGLASGEGGLDIRKVTLQEVTFIGTYCYTMADFKETLAGLADGTFGPIDWIEERPLGVGAEAFQELHHGKVAAAKIVLRMS